jgi:uncharacterized protein YdhG (YjbR/CyaY superfamily)
MNRQATTVDDYLAAAPDEVRPMLEEMRRLIREADPEAREVISYRIPLYKHDGDLVAFAAARNHVGLYIITDDLMEAHKDELKPYGRAKNTVRFPIGKPLPAALITTLVKERVTENEAIAAARAAGRKR